jgi:thymidylate synthase (FAD)
VVVEVLDHGFVELLDSMADDLSVVNSARVSFGKRHNTFLAEDEKLIGYLMKHKHGTPFEHNSFTFHVCAPIFVFREWQRHRIGSFNEMSARYMELPERYYLPEYANVRTRVGKPGHYTYETASLTVAHEFVGDLDTACKQDYDLYKTYLAAGIAPEQARCFLHVNHYSEMYWTVNARSLMNFLSLRNSSTAQWEIKQYAEVVEVMWSTIMPFTYEAFVENDRQAP